MKVRFALMIVAALLVSMFGAAAAQMDHDHGTPASSDGHGDHSEHMSATPGMQMENMSMGAFYLKVTNNGDEADRLVKIESDIAAVIEIHNVEMNDGAMTMVPQHDGVEIPAHGEVEFAPASYHVMLIGITESLIDGEEFTATLFFENAGEVEITVPIFIGEPGENEFEAPVTVGDTIEVSNVWARQAPKLDGPATPVATPAGTPAN